MIAPFARGKKSQRRRAAKRRRKGERKRRNLLERRGKMISLPNSFNASAIG
jgi:hypothetical protein